MVKIIADLKEETDEEFRNMVFKIKGLRRGVIKECLEEAVSEWIQNKKKLEGSE